MKAIAILPPAALSIFVAVKLAVFVGKRQDTRQAQRGFILNYDVPLALQRILGEFFPRARAWSDPDHPEWPPTMVPVDPGSSGVLLRHAESGCGHGMA